MAHLGFNDSFTLAKRGMTTISSRVQRVHIMLLAAGFCALLVVAVAGTLLSALV